MDQQKPVFVAGAAVLGITLIILGAFLIIKRAPDTELGYDVFEKIITPEKTDDAASSTRLVTAGKFGEPGDQNLWKMNGDFFTIEVLHEWEIFQKDSGGASLITFFDPDKSEIKGNIFIRSGSEYGTGDRFPFEEWVSSEVQLMRDVEECDEKEIGGLEMICYTGTFDEEDYWYYFAELNPELYVYVSKPVEGYLATPLWGAITSIDFSPSDKDVEEAYIIP
ncbi:MAG: hypothetical protein ABH846_02735 [Patescibacteria group bacterium]